MKARRGHKTDWNDCQFLANLLRHGLVRASFVPARAIHDLRDLTRRRRQRISDSVSERNRVQKVLEEANIKLGSVLSDVSGVSGQLMLEKLLKGEPDLAAIANLAQRSARAKIPEILQSLEGHRQRDHHRTMLRFSLEHLAFLEKKIIESTAWCWNLSPGRAIRNRSSCCIASPGCRKSRRQRCWLRREPT